jgi:hypothetical protein
MTTANDIVDLSLRDAGIIGVGQTALAEDANRALTRLNFMLGQWQVQRWLVYHLIDSAKVATGAQSYTVGPGGDFNVAVAPDRLENAFFRQLPSIANALPIDYPLEILEAREDYNSIALKTLTTFPSYIFYDSDFPLGRVYPWPVPQANLYEVHITLKAVLTQIANLATVVNLPLEYFEALYLNLAVALRDAYDLPPKEVLIARAKKSLTVVRGARTQIARLTMPVDLVRPGIYNPYSDQIR